VTATRDSEPVFEGYIYIVEDSWAIYAVDLDIKATDERRICRCNDLKTKLRLQQNNKNLG
jgi:hypothetical protein